MPRCSFTKSTCRNRKCIRLLNSTLFNFLCVKMRFYACSCCFHSNLSPIVACVASVPVRSERNFTFRAARKMGWEQKGGRKGVGRGKKGTLARKPFNFAKRPLVFTVEFINWLTTLSPKWNHNGATCIYKLVWRAISQMFVLEPAFPMFISGRSFTWWSLHAAEKKFTSVFVMRWYATLENKTPAENSKISVSLTCYRQIGSKFTNHSY